jgi:hypothetical protein
VHLAVSVYFQDNDFKHDFPLHFRHDETPNQGPHPDDHINLPEVKEYGVVYVDGVEYQVTMTGFLVEHGQTKIKMRNFDTGENNQASAKIFAQFKRTTPPGS